MGMDEAVAELADELMAQIRGAAGMVTETVMAVEGLAPSDLTELDEESYDAGVEAGMAAAILVLQQRGMLR